MRHCLMGLLTVALIPIISPSYAASTADCSYTYVDSFETNKAEVDSWSHSGFVEVMPGIHLSGVLMYIYGLQSDRGLGFYAGFEVDASAWLSYRFPLTPTALVVRGEIEFDIIALGGHYDCRVTVTYDSTAGGSQEITSGHHILQLAPPTPCAKVEVNFSGGDFALDNLAVCLDDITPARQMTWGQVKSKYR